MKQYIVYLLLIASCSGRAQQSILFTQYAFNKAGLNPAASGTEISQKINYTFGINRQWLGMVNSPKSNFVNFSMTLRPPRSYRHWQNVGVYAENGESGYSNNTGVYFTYAFHLLARKNLVVSFGVEAGARLFYFSGAGIDRNDPVLQKTNQRTLVYPDIIPGFRLNNKKFFVDVSGRQITTPSLQDYRKKQIGGPSRLIPSLYICYGKMIHLSDNFLLMPSFAVSAPIVQYPNIDVSAMLYYDSRMGAGLAFRNLNFLSVIYQVRIFQNVAAGFAYSLSINRMYYAAPNNFEVMVGVTPIGMATRPVGKHSIARCPGLDF